MNQRIGIIADDLTGANDSGVQLIEEGIHTSVFFDIPERYDNLDNGIVIDTNSRALSREEAFAVTKQAGEFLQQTGYETIYKKMDSTLRGHIGTELQALYDTFQPTFVFIAPAYPALGRTTRNGVHYVNGEKITDTEVSQDPKNPVLEASLPTLIEEETGQQVGLITKSDIDGNLGSFQEKLNRYKAHGVYFLVSDAESQDDLRKAAERIAAFSRIIWAGSAGLAEVLPQAIKMSLPYKKQTIAHASRVMTVCGSLSSITQNQVAFATEQLGVDGHQLDTLQIFSDDWETYCRSFIEACLYSLKEDNDVVLYVPSHDQIRIDVKQLGEKLQLSNNQISERISKAISRIVMAITEHDRRVTGLVLTGGDTAKTIAKQLGGIGFSLIKEFESGMPLGALLSSDKEFTIVTKAGSFGKENSIYQAMQELKGANLNE